MPSPQHITTYASDALGLLTSRYQIPRPFTPAQLLPVFWYRTSQGLTVVPTNDVRAWTDYRGSAAVPVGSDPIDIPADANFAGSDSVKLVRSVLQSVSINVTPDPTVLSIVAVGANDSGGFAGFTIYTATLSGSTWTVTPTASSTPVGVRIVEVLVVARSLSMDERTQLAAYYQQHYGVGAI